MKIITSCRSGLAALAGLALAGGAVLAGAAPAGASTPLSVTLCSQGNYTSYVKIVGGGLNQGQTHVAAGQCWTDNPLVSSSVDMYVFGIYNVSHKGFEIGEYGGIQGNIQVATFGQSTSPSCDVDSTGAPVSFFSIQQCPTP